MTTLPLPEEDEGGLNLGPEFVFLVGVGLGYVLGWVVCFLTRGSL